LHYFTRDTVGVSDYSDHNSLAKWDYVLNPENNTIVLGQRAKVVYDVNADNAKFSDGNKVIEEVVTLYKPDLNLQETTQIPTREGYRFKGWFTTKDNQSDKFTISKESFGVTGDQIVSPIAKESITAYAGWEKEQKVIYTFVSETVGKQIPLVVEALKPLDNATYIKGEIVTPKQPTQTEVALEEGKWVFKGYEPGGSVTVENTDINFKGVWVFEETKIPETPETPEKPETPETPEKPETPCHLEYN